MDESTVLVEYFCRNGMEQSGLIRNDDSRLRIQEKSIKAFDPCSKLKLAFLPEGYPSSVTSDYLAFQTWDTLQGLSTYIRSMLSTQALLSGFGVGTASATAIGATFQWFLRDLTGMLGGITFTLYQGSNLDNRAKQWRLAADFVNDIGMLMDLVSPLFPSLFMILLCVGSAARAVTGVASGATRAALTQHFARNQNAADVSAKEGSQETAATLLGMIIGMVLARFTANSIMAMWAWFLLLTAFHMYANYKAVRSLCLTSINAERISILVRGFLGNGKAYTPKEVSAQEVLLPFLERSEKTSIVFGARATSLYSNEGWKEFSFTINKYGTGTYLLICKQGSVQVILHRDTTRKDFLRAFVHALVLRNALDTKVDDPHDICINFMENKFQPFLTMLRDSGWDVDHVLISPLEWRAEWSNLLHQKMK